MLVDYAISQPSQNSIETVATVPSQFETDPETLERELGSTELDSILGLTVKRDSAAKKTTFLAMHLAQTSQDQYNVGFQAESGTGKTYIPDELVAYFPASEVRLIAGASPTSFFHEIGESRLLVELEKQEDLAGVFDEDELKKERVADLEYRKLLVEAEKEKRAPPRDTRRRVTFVNLANKIVVFQDMPHWILMEKLRPLLSHDRKILRYQITDRQGKGSLRTKTIVIKGYPTVVFATARSTREDQEKTRIWLLSPETTQEKIGEALELLGFRVGDRGAFQQWLEADPGRRWLRLRIHRIRETGIDDVVIKNWKGVLDRFKEKREFLSPRASRDWPRLLYMIKGFALLNCFRRERSGSSIYANQTDIDAGFSLYREIATPNELGVSPEIYDLYESVLLPLTSGGTGVDRKEIGRAYADHYHRTLNNDRLRREILPSLESAGLITQEADPDDRRQTLVWCTVSAPISSPENRGKNSAPTPLSYDLLVKALRKRGASTADSCLEMAETITGDRSQAEKLLGQLTADVVLAQAPDGLWRIVKGLEGS